MGNPTLTLSKASAWIAAARPKTLGASIAPVVVGSGLALEEGYCFLSLSLVILLTAMLIQVATNFANDVFDFERGTDTDARLGPRRMVQAGVISPQAMKRATFLALTLALALGCYLVLRGGWPIVVIGLSSLVLAIAYTAGPYALSYTGLGDIFVLLFFGPVAVGGTYYLLRGSLSLLALAYGLATGSLATGILVANNLRDINTDRAANKLTTAVRFGEKFARWQYCALLLLPLLIVVLLVIFAQQPLRTLFLALYVLPAGKEILRVYRGAQGEELNAVLANTSKVLLVFSLLSLGLTLLGTRFK